MSASFRCCMSAVSPTQRRAWPVRKLAVRPQEDGAQEKTLGGTSCPHDRAGLHRSMEQTGRTVLCLSPALPCIAPADAGPATEQQAAPCCCACALEAAQQGAEAEGSAAAPALQHPDSILPARGSCRYALHLACPPGVSACPSSGYVLGVNRSNLVSPDGYQCACLVHDGELHLNTAWPYTFTTYQSSIAGCAVHVNE